MRRRGSKDWVAAWDKVEGQRTMNVRNRERPRSREWPGMGLVRFREMLDGVGTKYGVQFRNGMSVGDVGSLREAWQKWSEY